MVDNSEMIFGVRAVIEAIQAGKEIDKILVKKDIQSDLSKELFAVLKGTLIPVQRVPVERINRVTRKNHQGVIAFISSVTYQKTEDLVPFLFEQGKNPLFVMLDGITDVRNFGAIARTCECAAVFIPTEVCHCVRRKLRCPTQIRLAHFFVHKQFPKFVIAYIHGSTPLLCCFMVSAFVLFLPAFRHLFISGLVLCFSIEQNSRIQLHFGPPKDSALTQKPRFCLRCLKRMRIFSAFFFEQPLNLIDNRKILFR